MANAFLSKIETNVYIIKFYLKVETNELAIAISQDQFIHRSGTYHKPFSGFVYITMSSNDVII